jgi:hypothetical protein
MARCYSCGSGENRKQINLLIHKKPGNSRLFFMPQERIELST